MVSGYVGEVLRVDLTLGKFFSMTFEESTLRNYIGGSGLAARILFDQVAPNTNPLGPDNLLIFMTGPLTATRVPRARFMDAKIASVAVNDERVRLLMTMPGLDYFAASLLVAEICDIGRFSSDKRLVSWAGLAPGVHQSGEKTVQGRITRQGNRLVRWVLVQAAQNARLHDDRFREFYERYAGGRVIRRLLWLWLMRCFVLCISC